MSKPTKTGLHDHNSTHITEEQQQQGFTTIDKAAVGVSVLGAALIVTAIVFLCRWKRRRNRAKQHSLPESDGVESFNPQNFAYAQKQSTQQPMRLEDIAPNLQPRRSAMFSGPDNPYSRNPNSPAPRYSSPAPPEQAHSFGRQRSGVAPLGLGSRRAAGHPATRVPLRRPVGGMQTTVESDTEY